MGKKLKGGRRQILQLEEKKPPKSPSKSKMKSLIHYSDSDDDSKKSNDSEPPSIVQAQKDATPLDSEIADFFKEIDALSVPEELTEQIASSPVDEVANNEAAASEMKQDMPDPRPIEADSHIKEQTEEVPCAWQEICDDSTGYSYYWNMHTNEVTWDCPEEYANYLRSLNSAPKDDHLSKETKPDTKKQKRKKESPQLPEGAIIPISYFGNTSSDNSSDSGSESPKIAKKQKTEKPRTSKKKKTSKKQSSKSHTAEKETKIEVFGPQLPPDFQPLQVTAIERKLPKERVEMGLFLPANLAEFQEESVISDAHDYPAELSTSEISLGDIVKNICISSDVCKQSDEKKEVKGSLPLKSYRPVVDYDSFTDEEEGNSDKETSNAIDAVTENKETTQVINSEKIKSQEVLVTPPSTEIEINESSIKTKTKLESKVKLKELILKMKEKEPEEREVDIDGLFAASYGKHGFGLGFHDQDDNETDTPYYKGKTSKKAVSFVKSDLVLNLGSLNEASDESDLIHDSNTPVINNPSNVEESEEKDEKETVAEKVIEEESCSSSSEEGEIKSPKTVILEETKNVEVLNGKNEELLRPEIEDIVPERSSSVESSPFELTDDLDEIDKALCEALYKKKAQNKEKFTLEVPTVASVKEQKNEVEPPKTEPSEKQPKKEENKSDFNDDTELKTKIVDMASILIDKLTFLLSSSSTTLPSLNSLFIQLQIRFIDWQASALDSSYFFARLHEVNDYLLHYETGVVSGDWTCQWDRANKRYFYLNSRTQFSQWTFPEELLETPSAPKMDSLDVQDPAVPSTTVDSRGPGCAPSPPPPPPGVDDPPLPPQTPPPSSPPLPPMMEPEDMDLDNSNDSTSQPLDYIHKTNPTSPEKMSQDPLSLPLFTKQTIFPISSQDKPIAPSLEEESAMVVGAISESGLSEEPKTKASKPVKRKKTKIQPGLGLKKKNIPSLVEKWQKIKEEQERDVKPPVPPPF